MSFWIYQEYLNNSYLQTYVGGFFQGGFFTTIILVAIGLFTIIALGLFAKLRSTRKELEGIISTDTFQSNGRGRGQPVDTRTEQHLIELWTGDGWPDAYPETKRLSIRDGRVRVQPVDGKYLLGSGTQQASIFGRSDSLSWKREDVCFLQIF